MYQFGTDLKSWYTGIEKMHLDTWMINTSEDTIISDLQERNAPKDIGVVLICDTGKISSIMLSAVSIFVVVSSSFEFDSGG